MKERGFDEAHAIIVRPLARGGYQIISGHRRVQAAKRAGLTTVPCWKREMTDDEAHMLLLSENIQDGLHPIEEGQHQIDSGLRQEAYAARIGVSRNTLKPKIDAARVYATIKKTVPLSEVGKRWRALAALRSAEAVVVAILGAAAARRGMDDRRDGTERSQGGTRATAARLGATPRRWPMAC